MYVCMYALLYLCPLWRVQSKSLSLLMRYATYSERERGKLATTLTALKRERECVYVCVCERER